MKHTRPWVWALSGAAAASAILGILILTTVPLSSDAVRKRIIATLSDHLDSDIELGSLTLKVAPRLHVEGYALTVRQRGQNRNPPLITVAHFTADADLMGLVRKHIAHVQLDGLTIQIPPDPQKEHAEGADTGQGNGGQSDGDDATSDQPETRRRLGFIRTDVVVDGLDAGGAKLVVLPDDPNRRPKVWDIHTLHMRHVGLNERMPFEARLTNAVPPGEIATSGTFGPWRPHGPRTTELDGRFEFNDADLSVFAGISGTLSARGTFGGTLGRIEVDGETDTPQFTVKLAGHPVPLHAKYHSTIDATNGDTILDRIEASFLKTTILARGSVIDAPGPAGRTVTLDISTPRARIEDITRLAVKAAKPPMTGALHLTTKFVLPPGKRDVTARLQLNGNFAIARARFTNYDVQAKIDGLSHRGRGRPESTGDGVLSNFSGRFTLGNGRLTLPHVQFEVPGAAVVLDGRYALRPETLDFRGKLLIDARVSDTTTGIKHMLLKPFDPLFRRKGGGSAIPIRIGGTREKPDFGLDYGRLFRGTAD